MVDNFDLILIDCQIIDIKHQCTSLNKMSMGKLSDFHSKHITVSNHTALITSLSCPPKVVLL